MSWFFVSGGQSISPSGEYSGMISFRILTGWISLQSTGLPIVFSSSTVRKNEFFGAQLYGPTLTSRHDMTTGETIALVIQTYVCNVMSLLLICCLDL